MLKKRLMFPTGGIRQRICPTHHNHNRKPLTPGLESGAALARAIPRDGATHMKKRGGERWNRTHDQMRRAVLDALRAGKSISQITGQMRRGKYVTGIVCGDTLKILRSEDAEFDAFVGRVAPENARAPPVSFPATSGRRQWARSELGEIDHLRLRFKVPPSTKPRLMTAPNIALNDYGSRLQEQVATVLSSFCSSA
jgi:hypothetical protein